MKEKRAEQVSTPVLLSESEKQKSFLLFQGKHLIMLLINPDSGEIMDANEAACKFYQLEHSELCKMNISAINILTEDEIKHEMQLAKEEKSNHFIFKHRLANGEIRDVEVYSEVVRMSNPLLLYSVIYDITDRLQGEKKLKLSEKKFKNLIENINDIVFEVDEKGIIKFISSSVDKLLGYPAEEIIGTSFMNFVGGNADSLLEGLKTLEENLVLENEYSINSKNGEPKWIRLSTRAIFEDGHFKGGTGTISNITEKKFTELAQQKSEALYRSILNASPDSIVITNLAGEILFTSYRTLKMFRFNKLEDLLYRNILDFVDTEDHDRVQKNIIDMLQGTFSGTKEYIGVRSDGSKIDIEANLSFIKGEDGKPVNMMFVCRDISDRIAAEKKIQKSEESYRKLVESINAVIYEIDDKGIIKYMSPSIENVIDYTPDELIEKNIFSFIYPDDLPIVKEKFASLEKRDYSFLEYRCVNKAGNVRWIRSSTTAIVENGKVVGGTGSFFDITLNKNAENEIKNKTALLSNLIINLKEGVLLEDSNRFIVLTNQLFCDMFGIPAPPEILIGADCSDSAEQSKGLFKNPEKFISDINIILANRKAIFSDELELVDGRVFERDYIPTYIDNVYNGQLWKYRDVTENKRAEEGLKKLSQAVEQSPVMTIITDLNGEIEYTNPKTLELTGYTREELVGKKASIFKSDKKSKEEYINLWGTIASGKEWKGEFFNKKKNGEFFWVMASISPVIDAVGKITHYLAVEEDITDRILAENEIRELNTSLEIKIRERTSQLAETNINLLNQIEERKNVENALSISEHSYRSVVENVKEIIFKTDANGLWVFLNKSWEELTGFSVEESLGQLFLNYVHPDDRQRNIDLFEPLISRKKDYCRHQVRYLTKDGGFRWVEVFARLGLDENNEITGTYGTLNDVTERKRAEDFENELLQLSPYLTGISLPEIDSALNLALSRIGQFLSVDRSYIFEYNQGENTICNTYEWCNEGIPPEIENLKNIPANVLPMWMEKLHNNENIILSSIKDLPESWKAEREILEPQGIKSLIVIPMFVETILIGFVGLDAVKEKKEFIPAEINILKVWSSIIASLINNQRNERLLEQTRHNYETFFNTIDDFLWVLDEKGNIIYTNNTVNQRLNYSNAELKGKSVLLVHPEERREEAGRIVGEMLAGISEYCPVPIMTKSGKHIPVETRVKAGNWDGRSVIFGVSKDVSKIKLSEEKFSKAFHSNSALMAISSFDDGTYMDVNESFLSTLGYTRDEVIGKSSDELNVFAASDVRAHIAGKLKLNVAIKEVEAEIKTKTGEILVGLFSADIIYISDQICLLTMMVDITLRKQAEEKIKEARLEADEANLAKSEFLSRMSHELRTPLNSILGFAQLLEMGELLPGQEQGIKYIRHSGRHLLDLINEVLDISRIEAGHISLSLEPIQISEIMEQILDSVQPLAKERRLTIRLLDSPDNFLFIKSDRQRLKQVLINILNNAIKYNQLNGSVHIRTAVMGKNEEGITNIRISITDTGLGISPKDIPKLFKPFERIGAERTDTEGTGLGLTVVKKLMDAMGGRIGVESEPGIGSTFWIEFPLSESQLENIDKKNSIRSLEYNPINKTGTILYIEDNITNLILVQQILNKQRSGIQLITEVYGLRAVPLAIKFSPDLILLDLNLPDSHGSEVLKLLQSEEETCSIPVVIISADAMPNQINKLLAAGAKYYLSKPLDIISFLNIVDEFVIG
jgi:PAS domain S-box-containing protein